LRLLPDATCAHQPGSVDSPKITLVSLAAVAERAQPLQRTAPSGRTQGQCSGCRRFADGVLAHVGTPGGSTSTAQPLLRLTRSPQPPCLCPSLTRSNRRGTRPVCRVVWEGWHREVSPYPDHLALTGRASRRPAGPLTGVVRPLSGTICSRGGLIQPDRPESELDQAPINNCARHCRRRRHACETKISAAGNRRDA